MGKISKKPAAASNPPTRSKGQASRETILLVAAKLATTRGLDRLSIGELAAEVGMSKSGLYAHFKSKEELELATIDLAGEILTREVLEPAMLAPPGIARLRALIDAFLAHLERRVFPGGCFVAAVSMELSGRPGPARDRIAAILDQWLGLLRQCYLDAQALGEIDPSADIAQTVFETESLCLAGNYFFIMTNSPTPLAQARAGINALLARLALPKPTKRRG